MIYNSYTGFLLHPWEIPHRKPGEKPRPQDQDFARHFARLEDLEQERREGVETAELPLPGCQVPYTRYSWF